MPSGPIIFGYDGSPAAEHAIRAAAALIDPRPALVVVVWEAGVAYETLEGPAIPAAPLDMRAAMQADQAMYDDARRTADRGARLVAGLGFDVESLVVADDATVAKTLVRIARERNAQALVVGAHGHNRAQDLFVGSTSRRVVERAPCPVVVVGPPAR